MERLAGRVAVITGAASGIGRAAARLMAANGAAVAVADLQQQAGEDVAAEIVKAKGRAIYVHTDVTDEQSVGEMTAKVVEKFGHIDILYNNAGGASRRDGSVVDAPLDEFWRAIKLDLFGTWLCSRAVIPHMIKTGKGSIINAGSIAAMTGNRKLSAYTASKGGVMALTRAMAVEFASFGIRVNAVVPAVVVTDRVRAILDANPEAAQKVATYPLGSAEPEDVANAALYLASDESNRVTGHMLTIDSGFLLI